MKFSIIVPIYNRAYTIERCIESIKKQECADFECLLIDDGSKDNSVKVCETCSKDDPRFHLHKKANGGVSTARNLGLDHARGEWLVFVDSDDTIAPNHLSNLSTAIADGIDMIFCGYCTEENDQGQHAYPAATYTGKDAVKDFLCHSDVIEHMGMCDRIFRRSIIETHHIRFDEKLPISEDRLFSYSVLPFIQGTATVEGKTYIISIQDVNSLSRRQLPQSVCRIRYEHLAVATEKLIKAYGIEGDEAILFWKYIWQLFVVTIRSLYNTKRCIFKAVESQQAYFEEHFCQDLYEQLSSSEMIRYYMGERDNQLILQQKFFQYDVVIFKNWLLRRLHIK